jgi:hypothetical protein
VAKLVSTQYLSVRSLLQEDHYDTAYASAGEVYTILVPESTVHTVLAETSHRQVVRVVEVPRGQLDEARSKLYPRQAEWSHFDDQEPYAWIF